MPAPARRLKHLGGHLRSQHSVATALGRTGCRLIMGRSFCRVTPSSSKPNPDPLCYLCYLLFESSFVCSRCTAAPSAGDSLQTGGSGDQLGEPGSSVPALPVGLPSRTHLNDSEIDKPQNIGYAVLRIHHKLCLFTACKLPPTAYYYRLTYRSPGLSFKHRPVSRICLTSRLTALRKLTNSKV